MELIKTDYVETFSKHGFFTSWLLSLSIYIYPIYIYTLYIYIYIPYIYIYPIYIYIYIPYIYIYTLYIYIYIPYIYIPYIYIPYIYIYIDIYTYINTSGKGCLLAFQWFLQARLLIYSKNRQIKYNLFSTECFMLPIFS